jgi:hypothetical protein
MPLSANYFPVSDLLKRSDLVQNPIQLFIVLFEGDHHDGFLVKPLA